MEQEQEVAPEVEATAEDVTTEQVTEDQPQEEVAQGEPEVNETEEAEQKAKSRHQRRREAMERLRTEADQAEARAKEAEDKLKRHQEQAEQSKPPKEADFGTFEEYQAALSGFHAMKQLDARESARMTDEQKAHQQEVQRIQQQQQAETQQQWASQVEDAKSRYADFEKVAYAAPISDGVANMVSQMEQGADVAYHLGMNPQTAQQLSQLPPMIAAMELGKIAASMSAPRPRTQTSAPPPTTPVKPKASPAKDPAKMTMAEYSKWRERGGTL